MFFWPAVHSLLLREWRCTVSGWLSSQMPVLDQSKSHDGFTELNKLLFLGMGIYQQTHHLYYVKFDDNSFAMPLDLFYSLHFCLAINYPQVSLSITKNPVRDIPRVLDRLLHWTRRTS